MRVRQHDRIERVHIERGADPVTLAQLLGTLKQAAVDQDASSRSSDEIARAGHGIDGPEEAELGRHDLE
jgi:hypothetical protein